MSGMAPAQESHDQAVNACTSFADDAEFRFRSPSPDELVWRRWEDAAVVFHTPSGDTLFLDPASALLLEVLTDGRPHTVGSLCAAAAARLTFPGPSQDDHSADREPAKAGTPTLVSRLQAVSGPDQDALGTHARALIDRLDRLGLLDRGMP